MFIVDRGERNVRKEGTRVTSLQELYITHSRLFDSYHVSYICRAFICRAKGKRVKRQNDDQEPQTVMSGTIGQLTKGGGMCRNTRHTIESVYECGCGWCGTTELTKQGTIEGYVHVCCELSHRTEKKMNKKSGGEESTLFLRTKDTKAQWAVSVFVCVVDVM